MMSKMELFIGDSGGRKDILFLKREPTDTLGRFDLQEVTTDLSIWSSSMTNNLRSLTLCEGEGVWLKGVTAQEVADRLNQYINYQPNTARWYEADAYIHFGTELKDWLEGKRHKYAESGRCSSCLGKHLCAVNRSIDYLLTIVKNGEK